jgi:hypothetical protein
MRLSDVLSKPLGTKFVQIDGFMTKRLTVGKQRQLDVGRIGLNFYCKQCNDLRTFWSSDKLYCIGVNDRQISIDCVLNCQCGSSVAVWFLVESYNPTLASAAW